MSEKTEPQQPLPIVEEDVGDRGHKRWTAGEGIESRALETPLSKEDAEMLLLQADMQHSLSEVTIDKSDAIGGIESKTP